MSGPTGAGAGSDATVDLAQVDAVERAGTQGWPPTHLRELDDGWFLRATPGLSRGRSNNALTPRTRRLHAGELEMALERVRAWSALHGIRGGLQVSPLELHGAIVPGLLARGWEPDISVWVMTADRAEVLERASPTSPGPDQVEWTCTRSASPDWLAAWTACRRSSDGIASHINTVFNNMGPRGRFGHFGEVATGIAVEDETGEWAGLFSLIVSVDHRGRGLGRRLVVELLRSLTAERIYLQVDQQNAVALSLYRRLGFRVSHSYRHLQAPSGWATG